MCVGIQSELSSWVVHGLKEGFCDEAPSAAGGVGVEVEVEDWWEVKFERIEEMSSVFDFSKNGRRRTEGPPAMIFLIWLESRKQWMYVQAYDVDSMSFMAASVDSGRPRSRQ